MGMICNAGGTVLWIFEHCAAHGTSHNSDGMRLGSPWQLGGWRWSWERGVAIPRDLMVIDGATPSTREGAGYALDCVAPPGTGSDRGMVGSGLGPAIH